MALNSDDKQKIINEYATVKGDTGSPEVQIALLTHKVQKLTDHLKIHQKDSHSRRGLLNMISKRRRLFNFLMRMDKVRGEEIGKKVGMSA
ncbi:MAG TPA: 30S ribosomal protein S15 [Patescibacteria group bacterium]|nr:30S ribosomal protein S15 [Patescibacteria group bacterium]